ncbi:MAG: hypothetical protein K2P35_05690 [Lachnospiraceae bacterium]|jgi:hypothetical protein|nr:hypothetical protein [Lachnospiraceae bacterium]
MNFLIITSFLAFSIVFFFARKRAGRIEAAREQEFWDREKRANFTRRKSLDGLNYITIPEELLNMEPSATTEKLNACIRDLNDLSEYQIVNLTGYTNTDLKLEYGTANITILSDFDLHYTNLVTLLQKLAELLHESGEDTLAIATLEFAVSTGTDVSKSYYLLADLYQEAGTPEKIADLIDQARNINTMVRDTIVQRLTEVYQ